MKTDEVAARVSVIATAILLFGVYSAFAQGKSELPSKDEVKVLLRRTAEETNLRSTGSSAFHLLLKAKSFGPNGEIVEGSYELWWGTSDHWSSRIQWANSAEVDVADNDRIWKQGEDTHLVESRRLQHILDFSSRLKWSAEGKIRKVKSEELDGQAVACVQIPLEILGLPPTAVIVPRSIPSERIICMESTSGLPLKFDTGASRLELGKYMAFSQKRFPKTLRLVYSGKTIMEIEVESLGELDSTKPNVFAVPVGVVPSPWCSDMVRPQPTRLGHARQVPFVGPPNSVVLPINPPDIVKYSVILFQVGEKGNALDVRAFVPGGEVLLKDKEKSVLLQSTFRPATCHGDAIDAEFPMEFHFPVL
jgi:hypothetical protein